LTGNSTSETPPTQDVSNRIATTALVENKIMGLSSGAAGITEFTYCVDSQTKMNAMLANTPGFDYTSVLIKKGTYQVNAPVNCTTLGIKKLTGQPGAILTNDQSTVDCCIKYDDPQEDSFIEGITVDGGFATGFENCANLVNCQAVNVGIKFMNCNRLYTGQATGGRLGSVKGTADPGDGSADGMVAMESGGAMKVVGFGHTENYSEIQAVQVGWYTRADGKKKPVWRQVFSIPQYTTVPGSVVSVDITSYSLIEMLLDLRGWVQSAGMPEGAYNPLLFGNSMASGTDFHMRWGGLYPQDNKGLVLRDRTGSAFGTSTYSGKAVVTFTKKADTWA
jgi:hypothetical protein